MRVGVSATIVILLLLTSRAGYSAEGRSMKSEVSHGTINIVLANTNGMVVLTDSMVTRGGKQHPDEPAQKLFQLDDKTVCTIAGFLFANAPVPELESHSSAMIEEFAKTLAHQESPVSIEGKLKLLAFQFNFLLTSLANIRHASEEPGGPGDYTLQLTVAGYDTDGIPKIGRIDLHTTLVNGRFDSTTENSVITNVEDQLVWKLAGVPDFADRLLKHPSDQPQNPVLAGYAAAIQKDAGRSMTIDQMKMLAIELARQTAKHPGVGVGGPNQVALLRNGEVASLEQQPFPQARGILHFVMFENGDFGQNALNEDHPPMLCVACSFNKMRRWVLDGNYFVSSSFTDSVLAYDGGPLYFDPANEVANSVLVLGVHAKPHSQPARDLINKFHWAQIEYTKRPASHLPPSR
jgi:20S proteasome alpha/beta subunit